MPDIDLKHLLQLAALELSDEEAAAATADLERIIEMIDTMQLTSTDGVAPMANPLDRTQPLRPDAVTEGDQREALQANAPASEDGFFLVPRVVE